MLDLRTEGERPERSDRSRTEELVRECRPDRVLACVACGEAVTRRSEAIEIGGEHRHVCVNPKGLAFDIGCFASAPGCVTVGPRESFWSWFPGHEWEIALCRGCAAHLGWSFHGADGVFWGLILSGSLGAADRVAEPRWRRMQGSGTRNILGIFRGAVTPQTAPDRFRNDRAPFRATR